MEESTVFKNNQNSGLANPQTTEIPLTPVSANQQKPEAPFSTAPSEIPPKPPDANPPIEFLDNGNGGFKQILKIAIGALVVIGLILAIIFFVLPLFAKDDNEQVKLTYWGLWEDSKVMQQVINDFQKSNPNIKVEYSRQDIKQYREKLDARMKNGTAPDIFRFHNTWYPMFSDYLLPIPDEVITKDEFTKSFYPVAQKDLVKNGAIYGIPLEIDTLALYVNVDAFTAAKISYPKDWFEFSEAANVLTVKDENGIIKTSGAAMGTYSNIVHAPDIVSLLLLQNGVGVSEISKKTEAAAGALRFYTAFSQGGRSVWDSTLDSSQLAFAKGNLLMYFGYSWDYFAIKSANPSLNFKVVPVPQLSDKKVNIASYWAEGVSAKSTNQEEALLFMKHLAKKETMEKIYSEQAKLRLFGEPYSRRDLADRLKKDENVYTFVSQGNNADSSYFAADTYDNGINTKMNQYLENCINSINSNTSIETSLEVLSQGVSQVLTQYGQN